MGNRCPKQGSKTPGVGKGMTGADNGQSNDKSEIDGKTVDPKDVHITTPSKMLPVVSFKCKC